MSLESAISFLCIIFIFAITPGPGVMAILARVLTSGIRPCVSMAIGMAVSDMLYLILACYGLAVIAEQWAGVFLIIRFTGSLYLLYLGWKMWSASPEKTLQQALPTEYFSFVRGLLQGFFISASNPKVIFFYIAFLPTIMDLSSLTPPAVALAAGLTLSGMMLGFMLVAVSAASVRRFLISPGAVKGLNRTAGGIMIGAASYLGFHG